LAEALDRSVLEAKGVSELREIARTLELKVSGLKKSEIIDLIAQTGNGSRAAGPATGGPGREVPEAQTLTQVSDEDGPPAAASSPVREVTPTAAPDASRGGASSGADAPSSGADAPSSGADAPSSGADASSSGADAASSPDGERPATTMPDEGAYDDRRDEREQRRRPQGRDGRARPREKAEPREGRGRRRRRGRGGGGAPHPR
jgi:hypothetical protein